VCILYNIYSITYIIIKGNLLDRLIQPETGQSHNSHLHAGEPKKPLAVQSKKMGASEQERYIMQLDPKAEGLEAPWRVTDVAEEAGVCCLPQWQQQ
jgi:hypothetical protein